MGRTTTSIAALFLVAGGCGESHPLGAGPDDASESRPGRGPRPQLQRVPLEHARVARSAEPVCPAGALRITSPEQLAEVASIQDGVARLADTNGASSICFEGDFSEARLRVAAGGTVDDPLVLYFGGSRFRALVVTGSNVIIDRVFVSLDGERAVPGGRGTSNTFSGDRVTVRYSVFEGIRGKMIRVGGDEFALIGSVVRNSALLAAHSDAHCLNLGK